MKKLNFDLTEEQAMIKKVIREFADEVVAQGQLIVTVQKSFQWKYSNNSRNGNDGLTVSEEYGGAGADTVSFAIVTEELSRACASTGITYSAHISLGGAPLTYSVQMNKNINILTPICTGESFGAFGLTEPNAGRMRGDANDRERRWQRFCH